MSVRRWKRRAGLAAALAVAALAGGCVEQVAEADLSLPPRVALARNPGVSPAGAAIAFASLDGAPAAALERFVAHLRTEAAAREIVMAEPAKARYLVRGYLSAAPTAKGAVVSYVWDVFDAGKRRALRMSDVLLASGVRGDVWATLDERVLQSLAAKSADDLAAFLSNTPEAVAAARLAPPRRDAAQPAALPAQTAPAAPSDDETVALAQ